MSRPAVGFEQDWYDLVAGTDPTLGSHLRLSLDRAVVGIVYAATATQHEL